MEGTWKKLLLGVTAWEVKIQAAEACRLCFIQGGSSEVEVVGAAPLDYQSEACCSRLPCFLKTVLDLRVKGKLVNVSVLRGGCLDSAWYALRLLAFLGWRLSNPIAQSLVQEMFYCLS